MLQSLYISPYKYVQSFFWVYYLEVELLSDRVVLSLALLDIVRLLSEVAVPDYTYNNIVGVAFYSFLTLVLLLIC